MQTLAQMKAASIAKEAARRANPTTEEKSEASWGDRWLVAKDAVTRRIDEHQTFAADLAAKRKREGIRLFGLINR